jgi:hypothetical protein
VDFSQSIRLTWEGRGFNHVWTLDSNPMDYRVTAGEGLEGLPGYAGRAGVYIRGYPLRTMVLGAVYVTIGLLAWEVLAPGAVLLPRLVEELSR